MPEASVAAPSAQSGEETIKHLTQQRDRYKNLAEKFSMHREAFGPKVPARDIMNGLIRNPDELLQRDRHGYDKIFANPIVSEQLATLITPLTSAAFEVVGGRSETKDLTIGEIINNIPNKSVMIESLCQSAVTGLRLVEIIWGKRRVAGVERNIPVDFKPHDHRRFAFDEYGLLWQTQDDRHGQVTPRNNLIQMEGGKAKYVPFGKMLAQKYRDGDGRYGYGHGLGLQLYRLEKAWSAVFGFWIEYAQSYSRPWRVAHTDEKFNEGNQSNGIDTALEDLQLKLTQMIENDTIVLPKGVSLELLQPPQMTAADAFFLTLLDKIESLIKLEITGEAISTTSDSAGGGSHAKSEVAARVRMGRSRKLADSLEPALSEYLLQPVIDFNRAEFGVPENQRIRIKVPRVSETERLDLMLKAGVDVLKSEFYDLAELTEPTADQINDGETFIPGEAKGGDPYMGLPGGGW